jgi:arylsulfatase A-like enzyme
MNSSIYQKAKPILCKVIDSVIIFYFLLLWVFYYTGGFVYEFFGITLKLTHIKNPLTIITTLWLIKHLLLFDSLKSVLRFFRNAFLFATFLLSLHLMNYMGYRYYLNVSLTRLDAYKKFADIPSEGIKSDKGWNVILISIDTLRADHLHSYGYERKTSPHIDKLASEGVLFKNHIAAAPATLISHASMFTSLNPSVHKAEARTRTVLDGRFTTLAEFLKKEGFMTTAFTGGGQMNKAFGLDQGFDRYDDENDGNGLPYAIDKVLDWLKRHKNQRFFLFFHTYQVHAPYSPPPPYDELFYPAYKGNLGKKIEGEILTQINEKVLPIEQEDLRHIVALYDGEIAFTDAQLGRLFDELKALGLWEKTLIVLTSDHGEEFDEHGIVGHHGHTLYEELLKIPLIIKFPDSSFRGVIVYQQSRGIDIFPTIIDILGFRKPKPIQGISLLPLIKNPQMEMVLPALSEKEGHELKSLRLNGYKLHVGSRKSKAVIFENPWTKMFFYRTHEYHSRLKEQAFYNLKTDPGETRNLHKSQVRLVRVFERKIKQLEEENSLLAGSFKPGQAKEDQELVRQLKGLGYLQ